MRPTQAWPCVDASISVWISFHVGVCFKLYFYIRPLASVITRPNFLFRFLCVQCCSQDAKLLQSQKDTKMAAFNIKKTGLPRKKKKTISKYNNSRMTHSLVPIMRSYLALNRAAHTKKWSCSFVSMHKNVIFRQRLQHL